MTYKKKTNTSHGDFMVTDMDIYALHLFVCQLLLKLNFSERFNKATSGWTIKGMKYHLMTKGNLPRA